MIGLAGLVGCTADAPPGWDAVGALRLSTSGYRASDDPCRRAGETAAVQDLLDDAADLVACPTGTPTGADWVTGYGARVVGQVEGYTLYRVPRR